MLNQKWFLFFVVFIAPNLAQLSDISLPSLSNSNKSRLPPCKICSELTRSFQEGMIKTGRGSHGEGDADWTKQRMKDFKISEVRLVEIQDSYLCKDVYRAEDQCHELVEELETTIEEWWFNYQDEHPDLHNWLCVERTKVCCPPNHFGANCSPCTDCNGNGVCKGNGTRKGNGKCLCDKGYSGETCRECSLQYYESFRDESKLLCSPCSDACKKDAGCTGAGPRGCRVCEDGWIMDPENGGCIDVNECASTKHKCTANQFCVNTGGSYKCMECDKSCSGCTGDGPDLCDKCAEGYEIREGLCRDTTNESRQKYSNYTRYLTYLGLCVATTVIFQSSTWAAAVIGLLVAFYITLSEYWLASLPSLPNGIQPMPEL